MIVKARYYALATGTALTVGVLANVGNAAPTIQHKPKPTPVVLGSSASLNTGERAVRLTASSKERGERIVATAKLPKGTYEVTGQFTGAKVECWLDTKVEAFSRGAHSYGFVDTDIPDTDDPGMSFGALGSGGETAAIHVRKTTRIGEYCAGLESSSSTFPEVLSAGITAIRVTENRPGIAAQPHSVSDALPR
jgi:hypothetical protein